MLLCDVGILRVFLCCVLFTKYIFVYIVGLWHQECEHPDQFILSVVCVCSEPCCIFIAFVVVVVVIVVVVLHSRDQHALNVLHLNIYTVQCSLLAMATSGSLWINYKLH